MARYFAPWNHREQAYYTALFSEKFREIIPWYDWFSALAPLATSLFPFSLIRHGDTVVQVGANRNMIQTAGGSQPLLLATCVGPAGRVIAIDSERVNVDAIEQAKHRANVPWIEVHQYAVSDHAGEIEGTDVDGHTFFYDPRVPAQTAGSVAQTATSREACPDLRAHWEYVEQHGRRVVERSECLDTILASANAPKPSLVCLTINGYEPEGIRGMRAMLDDDVVVTFVARATEAFWGTGFLEELESRGFVLVLSNIPHAHVYGWFPYITALRPHHLARRPNLIPGRFVKDEAQQVITFVDERGARLF